MPDASVQVVVRLRPLNGREQRGNTTPCVTASTTDNSVTVIKGAGKAQTRSTYKFADVFGSFATQEEIFDKTLEPGAPPRLSARCWSSAPPAARSAAALPLLLAQASHARRAQASRAMQA